MTRINVHLTEEQQQWVDEASLEIEDSRSEVIRRLIDAHRTAESSFEDGVIGVPASDSNGDNSETSPDAQSRDELLERIEKLEESLESQADSANGTADDDSYDDDGMGWR